MLEIVDSRGNQRAIKAAIDLDKSTETGIDKALWRSGKDVLGAFNKEVLNKTGKTGTIYIRKDRLGRRRRHQASAPGESPANRTGFYRKSAGFSVNQGRRELAFGNTADYSLFLELGTSKMKPRPGLKNAVEDSERDILRNLTNSISDEI